MRHPRECDIGGGQQKVSLLVMPRPLEQSIGELLAEVEQEKVSHV